MDALGNLGINLGYLLVQIFNFAILFLLLKAWVYEPIVKMIETRRVTIEQGLEDARVAAEARANAEQEAQTLLAEAQATGLPVLSSRVGGIPEVVLDGKSGFLLPQRDVAALVDNLSYLIQNPQLWPEMGRAGRRYVEDHYNLDTQNERLIDIYREMLDKTLP